MRKSPYQEWRDDDLRSVEHLCDRDYKTNLTPRFVFNKTGTSEDYEYKDKQ